MAVKLTEARRRALLWLPSDGAWSNGTVPVWVRDAVVGCVDMGLVYGAYAPSPRGPAHRTYRLTAAGIAARKGIEL